MSAGSTTIVATIEGAAGAIVQGTPNQFDNAVHEVASQAQEAQTHVDALKEERAVLDDLLRRTPA